MTVELNEAGALEDAELKRKILAKASAYYFAAYHSAYYVRL